MNLAKVLLISKRKDIIYFYKSLFDDDSFLEVHSSLSRIASPLFSLILFDASILSVDNKDEFNFVFYKVMHKSLFIIPHNMDVWFKNFLVSNTSCIVPFPCSEELARLALEALKNFFGQLHLVPPLPRLLSNSVVAFSEIKKLSFLGNSSIAQLIHSELVRASQSSSPVMLRGESGTGKSSAAEIIHCLSSRRQRKYLQFNSASISDELADGILFGVKKGCFTGAENNNGLFEQADKGTLFLDEIGVAGASVQAKLLIAMDTGMVYRVGDYEARKVDVRLIFATNEDLELKISRREFRPDFLYRIPEVIHIPPLREHREDICFLADTFLQAKWTPAQKRLSKSAQIRLENFDWPGNIRQLKNVVERSCSFYPDEVITADMLRFD